RSRRAHRRRRGRILLATAGLALAAGGLSLAELGTESSGSGDAQAAPDITGALTEAEASAPPSSAPSSGAPAPS
ncbi:hypothetical protein G3I40_18945, partial [Streptomyces sp. SID14478]|nr:hypothetical protein [Streptomyces sp. SID14478]